MTYPNMVAPKLSYPMPIPFPASAGSVPIMGGDTLVTAYSFTETTGTASAQVEIFDSTGAGGASLRVINIAAGQTVSDDFGPLGVLCRSGVFLQVNSGTVRGSFVVVDV